MKKLSAKELFEFAATVEKNGEEFYRRAAANTQTIESKAMFNFLADEEIAHREKFEKFAQQFEHVASLASLPESYHEFLATFAENAIFEQRTAKMPAFENDRAVLDFAVNAELRSILFYNEFKISMPDDIAHVIDEIIEQERRHFVSLSALRKKV